MVKVKKDLTGQAFGRLTVLRQVEDYVSPQGKRKSRWLCECNCVERNQVVVTGSKLKNGHTKSCGCLKDEKTSERFKKYNQYSDKLVDQYGEYYIGFASNTNSEFYFDAEDFDKVSKYCWHESIHTIKNYHVLRTYSSELKQHIKMHQLVFGSYCDHIDRNTLNNRKYNLRKATFTENAQNKSIQKNNTSGVVGISWNEKRKNGNPLSQYMASILILDVLLKRMMPLKHVSLQNKNTLVSLPLSVICLNNTTLVKG